MKQDKKGDKRTQRIDDEEWRERMQNEQNKVRME
jgi:hypothetical protein